MYIVEGSTDGRLGPGEKDVYMMVEDTDDGVKLTIVRKTFSSVRNWDGETIGSIELEAPARRELIKALTPT